MKLCPKCQQQFSSEANFCPVDATRLEPLPDAAQSDSLSSRFELGARIGGGRTGGVHRATDKTTGSAVAVKLVASSVVAGSGVAQRLERELHQLERVGGDGVAKMIASGKRGDEPWFAMEFVEGARTLGDLVAQGGPIAGPRAAEIIEAIGTALIEAAQAGVVHRDLAPKNVLFAGNAVKLINFALPVPTENIPGVPEFVAPEQVDGRPVDQRSNLYSLGALYYYLLSGQPVFEGTPAAVHALHRTGTIRPPSQVAPTAVAAGSPLEAAIMRALDRSPTKRFLTVRQFVDEVVRVGKGPTTQRAPSASRSPADVAPTILGVSEAAPPAPQPSTPSAPAARAAPVGPAQTVLGMASPLQPFAHKPVVQQPASAEPTPSASPQPAPVTAPQAPVVAQVKPQAQVVTTTPAATPPTAAAPAGKRKSVDEEAAKGKFRETMWFKKGDLDTQAAILAAEERSRTGKEADSDHVDSMPIDERYKDDGSITRGDKERYSLRTGATQTMEALRPNAPDSSINVSPDALIGEMKGGRGKVILGIIAAIIALILIVTLATR